MKHEFLFIGSALFLCFVLFLVLTFGQYFGRRMLRRFPRFIENEHRYKFQLISILSCIFALVFFCAGSPDLLHWGYKSAGSWISFATGLIFIFICGMPIGIIGWKAIKPWSGAGDGDVYLRD